MKYMDIKKPLVDPIEIERHESTGEALGTLLLIGVLVIVLSALFIGLSK